MKSPISVTATTSGWAVAEVSTSGSRSREVLAVEEQHGRTTHDEEPRQEER